jgi:hypothetical protein
VLVVDWRGAWCCVQPPPSGSKVPGFLFLGELTTDRSGRFLGDDDDGREAAGEPGS